MNATKGFRVGEIREEDRPWIRDLIKTYWMSEILVSRGRVYHADQLSGFIARDDNERVGLITYRIEKDQCEITTLNALIQGRGIGSGLIEAVRTVAEQHDCTRVWLVTTNDNVPAMDFYEKRGFRRAAIHREAMTVSRRLKPEIPLHGINGVPIRDEVEYAIQLDTY